MVERKNGTKFCMNAILKSPTEMFKLEIQAVEYGITALYVLFES
ncbi:hypothetical protein [Clostridium felsineum]|nr:hypothetical protein [Clostridium felsineum]